jgi:hypothetical protein
LQTVLYLNMKEITLEEKFFKDAPVKPPRGILLSLLGVLKFQSFYLRGMATYLTFSPVIRAHEMEVDYEENDIFLATRSCCIISF